MKVSRLENIKPSVVSHNARISKKQILDDQVLPALIQFSQAVFPAGEKAPAHSHSDMAEVFFVQQGHGFIQVDEHRIELTANTTVTVEPGEQHEIENTGQEDLIILYFGLRSEIELN